VTTAAGDGEYTITPALIDAVGRCESNADIDTYIDRHGVAGLATALTYAVARERGELTHRLMADDLDISPLAAEMMLQALRPVVHEHYDIEAAEASLEELDIDDVSADDACASSTSLIPACSSQWGSRRTVATRQWGDLPAETMLPSFCPNG